MNRTTVNVASSVLRGRKCHLCLLLTQDGCGGTLRSPGIPSHGTLQRRQCQDLFRLRCGELSSSLDRASDGTKKVILLPYFDSREPTFGQCQHYDDRYAKSSRLLTYSILRVSPPSSIWNNSTGCRVLRIFIRISLVKVSRAKTFPARSALA